jgi:cell division protein FtsW (lipid II flippase)
MAEGDQQPDGAQAPAQRDGSESKGWSEADRRTLIITITGTLIANLGTVLIVALAVVYDRVAGRSSLTELSAGAIWIGISIILVLFAWARSHRWEPQARNRIVLYIIFGLAALTLALGFLGLAAGVK